jgi:hypothetical protein
MGAASISTAQAQWTEAKIPGEQQRAAQGCAGETRRPGDWVCVLVRCERPGSPPSLHFSTAGPDIRGNIKLVIDDRSFALAVPASPKSLFGLSTRVEAVPGDLLEALKAGSAVSIEGSDLKPPYNRISLENSRSAIDQAERACARGYPAATGLWRRIVRGVGFF